jgi:hypothetical protein
VPAIVTTTLRLALEFRVAEAGATVITGVSKPPDTVVTVTVAVLLDARYTESPA